VVCSDGQITSGQAGGNGDPLLAACIVGDDVAADLFSPQFVAGVGVERVAWRKDSKA
jgi:hypothetical protein